MGIHLKGTIDPPLVGVAVTVLLSNGQAFNVITDKNGIYKAGPMAADVTHTVVWLYSCFNTFIIIMYMWKCIFKG